MTVKRREDIVVSLCLVSETSETLDIEELRRVADTLKARYRYWEMLIAVHAEIADDHENLLATVHNLRLLRLRKGVPFYRSRAAVASEAIGDVVVLTAATELSAFDFVDLIDACDAQGTIIIGRRRRKELMNPALIPLGRSAGFRVDGRDMLTAAFPRVLLQQVLAHPESQLALRFPPMDHGIPVQWRFAQARNRHKRSYPKLGRRLGLVHKLIVSSAPRVLMSIGAQT